MVKINMDNPIFSVPPISRYPSRREWEAACWKKLLQLPATLELLTTPHERHLLTLRAVVLGCIHAGMTAQKISREFWISRQTINAIQKSLHEHSYQSYRQRGKTERKPRILGRYKIQAERRYRGITVRTKYGPVRMP